MTPIAKQSLAEGMKKAAKPRNVDELQQMFGRPLPSAVAVPLRDDAYEVALDHIQSDPNQPRKTFDPDELQELADSIRENGVLQPITVYQSADPTIYLIITGERRFRAARLAELSTIPCIVRSRDYDPSTIDQQQLVENIQRADLAPIEAAQALRDLMERHGYSQREAAKKLGKPLMFVNELVSILKIPDELLDRNGVAKVPKQILVEVSRAVPSEQPALLEHALRGVPLHQVKEQRSNRKTRPRTVYYHEAFSVEGHPTVEVRWKKNPLEVNPMDLADALARVVQQLIERAGK